MEQGADVFYIVSTWEKDWTTTDGNTCHYADVYNPKHRADMDKEISRIMQGQSSNMPTTRDAYRQESCM